jgi:bacillopeptidase F
VASGQEPSKITAELAAALSRGAPAERVPVLVQVNRLSPARPLAFDPDSRAAVHASNLADLYSSSLARLRSGLPAELAADLGAGQLLWIGGSVAAHLTPSQVRELASQPSIQRIHYDGLIEVELAADPGAVRLWAPGLPLAAQGAGGLAWGLEALGAPELWAAGATGQGTVVAIIDSGVDGTHPLLWRSWRGTTTSPAEAWFDPWGLSATPVDDDFTAGAGHGTIVASIAVGSLEPGDTIQVGAERRVVEEELEVVTGVAPGAQWVAANGFEGLGGVTYTRSSVLLQSMQWVLDPDGDPATVSDVPDVLNNSWGFPPGGCDGPFDRAIDALEAAGVPVVFAAGNLSSGFQTVAAPAERADLLLNAFAVGAVELDDGEIVVSDNSLGGPSPCAPGAVKPEVVAPGEVPVVRNLGPHTGIVLGRSGVFTSWASPHVAGALAVLRGLNRTASAGELKAALYSSADDLPPPGLDNRSGAGFLDLVAAAELVGGLGGVRLAVADWAWDSTSASLDVELHNRGGAPFPGGSAELRRVPGDSSLAHAQAPMIGAQGRGVMTFFGIPDHLMSDARLSLRLESDGAILDLPISLSAPTATAVVLEDGDARFSLDARGRLGRVAGDPGFQMLGGDWLTAGAFLYGDGDRVSDAAYVDVLQRPSLKQNPVASDTDWRDVAIVAAGNGAEIEFSDDRALNPLGATVHGSVNLVVVGDSAAFAALSMRVDYERGALPLAGVLLDWDLSGRDSVSWDAQLAASVMTAADSSGPWVALATVPRPPATHAAIPLGTPEAGHYLVGSDVGVLAKLGGFTDAEKARFMRLGGPGTSRRAVEDWAQLVTVGPLARGETITFLAAIASSKAALRATLDSARAFAADGSGDTRGSGVLALLPAYPNPFDPGAGRVIKLPFLADRGSEPLVARLDIYTIAGRLVHSERREYGPDVPVEPFSWNGVLADGKSAASGVYGYIIRVGRARKYGKFVVLK